VTLCPVGDRVTAANMNAPSVCLSVPLELSGFLESHIGLKVPS
jgi:hypothetical protein